MITETTKYGTTYETPQGLKENKYYELMYEFIDLVKTKGLIVRQAHKLFINCADMIFNVKPVDEENNKISDTDRIVNELDKISCTLLGLSLHL